MKEKRRETGFFLRKHSLRGVVASVICVALIMAGCGSDGQVTDSNQDNSSTISTEALYEGSSGNSGDAMSEVEVAAPAEASDIGLSTALVAVSTDNSSEDSSNIDSEYGNGVDMAKVIYFDEPVTMYSQRALNVRSGPSTDYDICGFLECNTEVSVIGQYGSNGWFLIDFSGGEAFASNRFLDETQVDLDALKAEQEAEALAAIESQKAQQQSQQQTTSQDQNTQTTEQTALTPVAAPAGVLFIGDSRCVQMKAAVDGGGCSWICENAKGYVWLNDTAIARADAIVGNGTKVVICLGVNDTGNIDNYATLVNTYAAAWAERGATTYFCSVNPVWENPYRTEEQVIAFNNAMPGKLNGIIWLDTHSWLETNGYRLVDGLHYDANTYINLFNYIISQI